LGPHPEYVFQSDITAFVSAQIAATSTSGLDIDIAQAKRTVFYPWSNAKKYGSLKMFSQRFLERLDLTILPHPTVSARRRKKKADSFWSAPMSE
jgi:hypothetical protein